MSASARRAALLHALRDVYGRHPRISKPAEVARTSFRRSSNTETPLCQNQKNKTRPPPATPQARQWGHGPPLRAGMSKMCPNARPALLSHRAHRHVTAGPKHPGAARNANASSRSGHGNAQLATRSPKTSTTRPTSTLRNLHRPRPHRPPRPSPHSMRAPRRPHIPRASASAKPCAALASTNTK